MSIGGRRTSQAHWIPAGVVSLVLLALLARYVSADPAPGQTSAPAPTDPDKCCVPAKAVDPTASPPDPDNLCKVIPGGNGTCSRLPGSTCQG